MLKPYMVEQYKISNDRESFIGKLLVYVFMFYVDYKN